MPLSDVQIFDIVDFLHRRVDEIDFSPQFSRAEVERMLLTGDANAGKVYFNGVGGCAACHSLTGDLKGIASKYDPVALELRFISPVGARSTATVTPASGQQIKGQLLSLDAFDVSIQGDDGWNHTWSRNVVKVDVHDPLAAHWDLIPKYSGADIHNLLAYLETLK